MTSFYKIKYQFNDEKETAFVAAMDGKSAIATLESNIGTEVDFIESIKCVIDSKKINRIILPK